MLKFNTFRAQRYLRSRFIEGTFLLASEATDIELELIDFTRALIRHQVGDVAIGDAWKVERIDQLNFRIKPGEAWFDGLPYSLRSSSDQLVSGNSLALGIVPVNTTIADDPSGSGKIVTLDGSTPDDTYRVVIQAREEVVTNIDDPFIKNANLSESTAQKMRLNYTIHIVPETDQVSSPVPYTGDNSTDKNLVNEISVQVGGAGSAGSLVSINQVTGSEQIDGRDIEVVIVNQTGANPVPKTIADQASFSGGKLIDNVGNEFHIVSIFNNPADASNQEVIRIDKEVDQPDPVLSLNSSYTLVKRDVFTTDDVNGTPNGKRYYPVSRFVWKQTDGLVHSSTITDLRQSIEKAGDSQDTSHTKFDLRLAAGGTVTAEPTVKASATFEITDYTLLAGDTFEVRGVNFVEGVDFNAVGDNDTTAAALAQAINDSSDPLVDGVVEAVANLNVVTITATQGGTAANSYTLSFSDDPNGATTGGQATLEGGVDATEGQLLWSEDFEIVNPHGVAKFIVAAGDAVLRDGGALAYFLDYEIGSDTNVEFGELAVTTTSNGTSISLSGAPNLSQVKIGNTLLIEGTKESAAITAIDDVNKTLTVDTSLAGTGSAIIYLDTFAPGTLPLGPETFVLAVKTGDIIQVTNGVGLESGEGTSGAGGVPQQLLDFIGSEGETDDSPNYSSTSIVGQGDDLTTAIGKLDSHIDGLDHFTVVDYIDITTTALPNTPAVTIDGNALVDGDKVLFTNTAIEGIYQVSNIGVSADWTLLRSPEDADFVSVQNGTTEWKTLWERSGGDWRLVNTSELESDPSGFPNRTDTTISFDDGTRTFTITPVGSEFEFYAKGKPYRKTAAQSIVIPNTEGVHFIYFDGDTGALATTSAFTADLLSKHAYVAVLYWDATNAERVYFGEERHGLTMDHDTHIHFHNSFGAQYKSGLDLTGFSVDGDGSVDAHAQFTSTSGEVRDEDILNAISAQAQIPILYRDGASGDWRKKAADAFPVIYPGTAGFGGARLPYNEFTGATWQLTQIGNGNYVLVHFFGTNDVDAGVVGIQGQSEYTNLVDARAGAAEEITTLSGLPFQEFTPIGTVIFQSDAFSNTPNAIVVSTESGEDYIDFRGQIGFGAGSGPGDHGSLSGLNDPDHGPTAVTTTGVAKDGAFSSSDTDLQQALDTLDKTLGTLRLKKNASSTAQVDITGALRTLNNSDQIDQVIGDFLMDFSGETIDFTTGTTVGATNIVGLTPVTSEMADGEYKWFAIGLLPDTVNVAAPINRMVPQIQVNPAASSNAVQADAPLPFMVGDVKLGAVLVQRSGATAVVVEVNKLGVGSGSGGGGTGDANSLVDFITDNLMDSLYEFATPNVFAQAEDTLIDSVVGASYSLISKNLTFPTTGDEFTSTNMLDSEFTDEDLDIVSVRLMAFWDRDAGIDPAATYEVSRDGGSEFQAVTMERIGNTDTFVGDYDFVEEAGNSSLAAQAVTAGNTEFDATTQQTQAMQFTLAATSVVRELDLDLTVNGSPTGKLKITLASALGTGQPVDLATKITDVSVDVSSLSAGTNTITIPRSVLGAGTYYIIAETDSDYKAGFATGVTSIEWNDSAAGTDGANFDGAAWTTGQVDRVFDLKGYTLDLRVKITSGTDDVELAGYGILYGLQTTGVIGGIRNRYVEYFNSTDNPNEFTLSFLPDPDLLRVYLVQTGQVFKAPAFVLDGKKVIFPADSFDNGGIPADMTLVFDQTEGSSFDNSDQNALLLASNFLGSTDPSIDRSVSGRGIFLRRPDGTLREIALDDNDNLQIWSV